MNGMFVFGGFVVAALVVVLIVIVVADSRSGKSVRRKEYDAMKAQLDLAQALVDSISDECDTYAEIDHPVVSKLKPLISDYYKEERKLRR